MGGIDFVGTEITPGPAGIASLGQQSDVLQTTQQSAFEAVEKGLDLKFFAGMGNFKPKDLFELDEPAAREAVKVQF